MTPNETDRPRTRPRKHAPDRTILALLRTGTCRCRLLAAFMAVALISQFAGAAYAQSGQTVLYLDAPSVSSERAEYAGEVASAYSAAPGSPVTGETLAWLALPGGGLELAEAPEEALGAFASLTAPNTGAGVGAEEASAAGETMLAQLGEGEEHLVGEEDEELAAGVVRPRLGAGSTAPEVEPEYEDETAIPATHSETTDPGSQDYESLPPASTPNAPRENDDAPAGDLEEGESDGAGLVVAESGAEPEMPTDGTDEVEFASAPSETSWFAPGASGDAEQSGDYGPAGPVSNTEPPPIEEEAPVEEEATATPLGEAVEERTTMQTAPPFVSEPEYESPDEMAEAPLNESFPAAQSTSENMESSPEPATAHPPMAQTTSADTGPTGDESTRATLVATPAPDAESEYPTPEESVSTVPAPVAEPVGTPAKPPTSEGSPPPPSSAPPEDLPSDSEHVEIEVGGASPNVPSERPVPHEGAAPKPEASSSQNPAPDDGGESAEGGEPEPVLVEPTENPAVEIPAGESPSGEVDDPFERPQSEEATAGNAPDPARPVEGDGDANEGVAPGVPNPAGEPETASSSAHGQAGGTPPLGTAVSERRMIVEKQQEAIERGIRRREILADVRAERLAARQAEQQAVATERQTAAAEQSSVEQAASERAAVTNRQVVEQAAIRRQVPTGQVVVGPAAIEQMQALQQAAAEEAAIEQTAAEQAVVVERQETIVGQQQTAYPPTQPTVQTPARQFESAPEALPVPQPQAEQATQVTEPTQAPEPTPRVEQPLPTAPMNNAPTGSNAGAVETSTIAESTTRSATLGVVR